MPNNTDLQSIVDASRDGICVVQDNQLVLRNRSFMEMFHLPADDTTFTYFLHHLTEIDLLDGNPIDLMLQDGPIRYLIVMDNSRKIEVEMAIQPITFDGNSAFLISIQRLTDAQNSEQGTNRHSALLESLLDTMDDAVFILDTLTMTVRSSNRAVEQIFRIERDHFIGHPLWNMLADFDDPGEIEKRIKRELESEGSVHIDLNMKRIDGTIFPAIHSISQVPIEDGLEDISAVIWIVCDMSARSDLHRTISELELRYRILFERSGDPTFLVDSQLMHIIDVNQAAQRQLGYSRNEMIGMTLEHITPSHRIPSMINDFEFLLNTGSIKIEGINLTKDGDEIPVQISAVVTEFDERKVFLITCHDVSLHRELEKCKLRDERIEAIRRLAGGISHELSQPLQGLTTIADLLNTMDIDDRIGELTDRIAPLVDNITTMLNKIKSIVRFETTGYSTEEEIIDLVRSSEPSRILVFDDDDERSEAILQVARTEGIEALQVKEISDALKLLDEKVFDVLLYGSSSTDVEVVLFLETVKNRWPNVQIVTAQ